jgi:hypothetical protein
MLEVDEAPERLVKFLLLPDVPRCEADVSESLAIDNVEEPIFDDDTSRLFVAWLPADDDKFGEPERTF